MREDIRQAGDGMRVCNYRDEKNNDEPAGKSEEIAFFHNQYWIPPY